MEKSLITERCNDITENIKVIRENVAKAALDSGRKAEDIKIMAVTKTVEPVFINHAISCGMDLIGENKVQEFLGKRDFLNLENCQKHLIGHLQTNKVKQIVGQVDMIESVDSVKVAKEIGKHSVNQGIITPVLVEFNIGSEESKTGADINMAYEMIDEIAKIEGIKVKGMMTIPPFSLDEKENRKNFSNMYRLFIDIKAKKIDNVSMDILSMGMSNDYREAIVEGANLIRVGSAMFGARMY
ncbi:MAG: YggS family pyridoxal phosphate-dependent enzyme [Clostridiales bacterium]|nr:YggS family pyridoxal phosphate-dependent enzyme [Clostridiales bacterium]